MAITLAALSGCQQPHQDDLIYKAAAFEDLKGFETQDFTAPALSFQHSCQRLIEYPTLSPKVVDGKEWGPVCQKFLTLKPLDSDAFRSFLKAEFKVAKHETLDKNQGLLTGYFQPEIDVSHTQSDVYKYPIYKRPPELIVVEDLGDFTSKAAGIRIAGTVEKVTLKPYVTRSEIQDGALSGKGYEIAWAKDNVDLFFMHIQGSGRLAFEDGTYLTLSYDGTNGMAYTAIGHELMKRGEISKEAMSMEAIKAWLRQHPDQTQPLLNTNESYVFFKVLPKNAKGPIGAQKTPLTPFASLAVDPYYIPLGSLVWIETDHPEIAQRLGVTQDVGGAIKGPLRGDFYCGSGEKAGSLAGPLKAPVSFYTLTPKS